MSALLRWIKHQWDRTAAIVCIVVGLVSVLLGWVGISRAALPTEQLPYLASGGVLGLFVLGVGATLWLSADLRDEWRKLDEIHDCVRRISVPDQCADTLMSRDADAGVTANG